MEAEFYAAEVSEGLDQGEGLADTDGWRVAHALVFAALGDFGGVGVAEEEADLDAGVGPGGEELEDTGVFEEEESAVDEDVDLLLSVGEKLEPDVVRDCPAVGVGGADFGAEVAGAWVVARGGPQFVLVEV